MTRILFLEIKRCYDCPYLQTEHLSDNTQIHYCTDLDYHRSKEWREWSHLTHNIMNKVFDGCSLTLKEELMDKKIKELAWMIENVTNNIGYVDNEWSELYYRVKTEKCRVFIINRPEGLALTFNNFATYIVHTVTITNEGAVYTKSNKTILVKEMENFLANGVFNIPKGEKIA